MKTKSIISSETGCQGEYNKHSYHVTSVLRVEKCTLWEYDLSLHISYPPTEKLSSFLGKAKVLPGDTMCDSHRLTVHEK